MIWWLYTDDAKKDPVILDLEVEQLLGGILFTVRKADGKGFKPAKGATVTLDGVAIGTTDAKGQLSHASTADWNQAIATMTGAIDSQLVIENPLG